MTHPHDTDTRPPLHVVTNNPNDDLGRTPPTDNDAERAVLGGMLNTHLDPHTPGHDTPLEDAINTLRGADFYRPAHELIYNAITTLYTRGDPIDPVTTAAELHTQGNLTRAGGHTYLWDLTTAIPTTANTGYYADIVARTARLRQVIAAGTRLIQLGHTNGLDNLDHVIDQAVTDLTTTRTPPPATLQAPDLDTFLNTTDPDHAWLIPGFLERQDRFILTAAEGDGKSTLLRQFGIQAAAGINPLTGDTHTPIRVLQIDLENSDRQTRRELRPLRAATPNLNPHNYRVICKLDGLDLTTPEDQAWLDNIVTTHTPDLLITGPIYKLAGGNPNDEKDAKPGAMFLDKIRATHDVALLLEAHAAKAPVGSKQRPIEPFGWSGWLRWPEFGINLGPTDDDGVAELRKWRGMREASRTFPTHLKRGGTYPWTVVETGEDYDWSLIVKATREAGHKLSQRSLVELTGLNQSRIQRLVKARSTDWTVLLHSLEVT